MAKNETRRMKTAELADDEEIYAAVKDMPTYAPSNPAYTIAALDASNAEVVLARQLETQAAAAAAAARDNAVAAEWKRHNLILGTKDQVVAQYGPDSNEVQAIKLKKKSEYKSPGRKTKTGGGTDQ
jgi:hypothetical protein